MAETAYYVYALKDPRSSPARPFYIGKGTGTRAYDHLVRPDGSRKGVRIAEIVKAGHKVLVSRLVEDLSEEHAIKLEAELIAAFGTEDTGGLLTNSVVPSGLSHKSRRNVVVPQGASEKAQLGLGLLKGAVLEFAKANPDGITNSDAASLLGLRSDLWWRIEGLSLLQHHRVAHARWPPEARRRVEAAYRDRRLTVRHAPGQMS